MKETHGHNYTLDYFTDVLRREAVKFIEEASDSPMFMYIATPSPHRPATPAPQYDNKFSDQLAPRTPSYNEDSKDRHWIITEGTMMRLSHTSVLCDFYSLWLGTPVMTEEVIGLVDQLYQMRLETLLSVQDLVQAVIETLEVRHIL